MICFRAAKIMIKNGSSKCFHLFLIKYNICHIVFFAQMERSQDFFLYLQKFLTFTINTLLPYEKSNIYIRNRPVVVRLQSEKRSRSHRPSKDRCLTGGGRRRRFL